MKYTILVLVAILVVSVILAFCLRYIYHKPKTITITKEVKVYDFSQEPQMMEYYANMMGKSLISKKEIDEYKRESMRQVEDYRHYLWQNAYQEGYRVGYLNR